MLFKHHNKREQIDAMNCVFSGFYRIILVLLDITHAPMAQGIKTKMSRILTVRYWEDKHR